MNQYKTFILQYSLSPVQGPCRLNKCDIYSALVRILRSEETRSRGFVSLIPLAIRVTKPLNSIVGG